MNSFVTVSVASLIIIYITSSLSYPVRYEHKLRGLSRYEDFRHLRESNGSFYSLLIHAYLYPPPFVRYFMRPTYRSRHFIEKQMRASRLCEKCSTLKT